MLPHTQSSAASTLLPLSCRLPPCLMLRPDPYDPSVPYSIQGVGILRDDAARPVIAEVEQIVSHVVAVGCVSPVHN